MFGETRHIKESGPEGNAFRIRALIGFGIIVCCLLVLLARFFVLQVLRHDEFQGRSEANRVKPRVLPPSRGLIYDRKGRLVAENVLQYRLEIIPEQVPDMAKTLVSLQRMFEIEEDDIARFKELLGLKRSFESLPLKFQLDETEVARFAVNRHSFPGVDVVPYQTRYYPTKELLAHVIGYVGRIDRDDRERLDQGRYAGTSHIGKTGIERYYENKLLGEAGYDEVETDAQGRALRVLSRKAPKPGANLHLTIDLDLQAATVAAFSGRSGAAVAIDPRNGELLALVSLPSFDANLFVNGIPQRTYQTLIGSPSRPLYNRFLMGGYEPGSTMKPFIALAGLELGARTPEDGVFSSGAFMLPGVQQAWHDWKEGGHGYVDLNAAIAQSVNTYFYKLAVDLGIDRMSVYLAQFGFGKPTGIDLNGENSGILPTREWKRKRFGKEWYQGETVIAGIGQGYWVVTPLQLANAVAMLANEGVAHRPHLVLEKDENAVPEAPSAAFVKNAENIGAVVDAMVAVLHSPGGTAYVLGKDSPYLIAGKSGTAQRYRRKDNAKYDESKIAEHLRHQALFVAFAPAEAPRIAVAVVVEHGSSGSKAAGPVAKQIIDAYLRNQ